MTARATLTRRAGIAIFVLGALAVLAVTQWPFAFDFSAEGFARGRARIEWIFLYRDDDGHILLDGDLIRNLLLLAPLGAGWALLRVESSLRRTLLEALLVGAAMAMFVETLQIFTPTRVPQLADVWRNTLGCVLASPPAWWLGRRFRS